MRAGAEMLAPAERDLFVGSTFNVEAIRIVERLLVAIPRGQPQRQPVAFADMLAADLDVVRRDARDMRNRTAPPDPSGKMANARICPRECRFRNSLACSLSQNSRVTEAYHSSE